jgi:translation initiation factor 6 (eIF-6)
MISEYVTNIADQMEIQLSRVTVVEGHAVGCSDVLLLHLTSDCLLVSTLVYQSELDELQNGSSCERLEAKIRLVLARLIVLDPKIIL